MSRGRIAKEYFLNGYNCSQSVVLAFKDLLRLDEPTLQALSSSFGGGISRLRSTCGCISGMALVLGLLYGNYDILNDQEKGQHYALIQKLALDFKNQFSSIKCSELLSLKEEVSNPFECHRDEHYYQTRPCMRYIEYMANLIESEIQNHE